MPNMTSAATSDQDSRTLGDRLESMTMQAPIRAESTAASGFTDATISICSSPVRRSAGLRYGTENSVQPYPLSSFGASASTVR